MNFTDFKLISVVERCWTKLDEAFLTQNATLRVIPIETQRNVDEFCRLKPTKLSFDFRWFWICKWIWFEEYQISFKLEENIDEFYWIFRWAKPFLTRQANIPGDSDWNSEKCGWIMPAEIFKTKFRFSSILDLQKNLRKIKRRNWRKR